MSMSMSMPEPCPADGYICWSMLQMATSLQLVAASNENRDHVLA